MNDKEAKSKAASYAFPSVLNINGVRHEQTGMTLRDWFAGQALSAVYKSWEAAVEKDSETFADLECEYHSIANDCYSIADAMIAARENGGNNE